MMFKEHFNSLLIPLKQTSKNFVSIFITIANAFDILKIYAEDILYRHFIQSKSNTEKFAKDRGIQKLSREDTNKYYDRVLNAYDFLKNSSTTKGIIGILKSITDKEFELREIYLDDFELDSENELLEETTILGSDDSNLYFIVSFPNPLTVEEKAYIEEVIELYKPAHVGFRVEANILDEFILDDDNEKLEINTYLGE